MPSPPVEFEYIDGIEDLSLYSAGGYHPVRINDQLGDRYRIAHKLGHGTFSTTWLAVDDKTSKFVAVKIGTADASRTEDRILLRLTQSARCYSNSRTLLSLIPVVLDRFDIHGPNGTHSCLVTRPARCSLRDARVASDSALFQLDVARSLIVQLAQAVSLVHSQGYAHGDLHLGNMLLRLSPPLNGLSIDQLYSQYGRPQRQPIIHLDTRATTNGPGVPPYAVLPMSLGKASDEIALSEAKLLLSDFGVAFRPSEKTRSESNIPIVLRPPEAFFEPTTALTLASDVWSLGCVIFELLAHRSLIDGFLAPQHEIIAQQVELQGVMPSEWWKSWVERPKWYDEAGEPLSNPSDIWSWERRFEQWVQAPRRSEGMKILSDKERDALFELLKWMLAWKPSERPDMSMVMESEWITRWALPTFGKGWEIEAG